MTVFCHRIVVSGCCIVVCCRSVEAVALRDVNREGEVEEAGAGGLGIPSLPVPNSSTFLMRLQNSSSQMSRQNTSPAIIRNACLFMHDTASTLPPDGDPRPCSCDIPIATTVDLAEVATRVPYFQRCYPRHGRRDIVGVARPEQTRVFEGRRSGLLRHRPSNPPPTATSYAVAEVWKARRHLQRALSKPLLEGERQRICR